MKEGIRDEGLGGQRNLRRLQSESETRKRGPIGPLSVLATPDALYRMLAIVSACFYARTAFSSVYNFSQRPNWFAFAQSALFLKHHVTRSMIRKPKDDCAIHSGPSLLD